MNIIIPMAGMGKRMRPHTLTVPKPLIPIAGKPIVHRLVEDIVKMCGDKIAQIGFVVGRFGNEVEQRLLEIAAESGAEGRIFYQDQALGTAHAVYCAQELMHGPTIVAFADTLFKADFELDSQKEGIVWVQKVEDPSAFGVVKLNGEGQIIDFVEKPREFISDLAIIGIYYFKQGELLRAQIRQIIDEDIKKDGEYQLTTALDNLQSNGLKFYPGEVDEWLDCGNKDATIHTNQRYLEYLDPKELISKSAKIENSIVIPPVYIGKNVTLHNTVVGPHVSIGDNSSVTESRIRNGIIQADSTIENANIANSMIGNFVMFKGKANNLNLGDYSVIEG